MGGGGSTYDYGFRIYNPGLARFLSVDPLTKEYPWYTPYQFAGNTPIQAIDRDGLEEWHFTLTYNHGEPILKLDKVVETRGIPGTDLFDYTPTPTVYVNYPEGSVGDRSFTFTEHGYSTGGNTIEGFLNWAENPEENGGGDISKTFPSDAATNLQHLNTALAYGAGGKGMARTVPKSVASKPIHGNSKQSQKETTLYRLEDKKGNYLKTGVTSKTNPERRYTKKFMNDKVMKILDKGKRSEMLSKERDMVEKNPGSLNKEPWAGKQKTEVK